MGYPMAKRFAGVATIAHSLWNSLVTWTDLSNNCHIDELVSESATSV